MKITNKVKRKWKNNRIKAKKKKQQQKRDFEQAIKIYRGLPKKVKLTRLKKTYYIFGIISSIIVIIWFIGLILKDWT